MEDTMTLKGGKITWLGHSTFLLDTDAGHRVLIDPWLAGNPKCPAAYHEVEVDAILITHGHGDHLGDVFTAHTRCKGPIVGIYDLTTWLATKGVEGSKLSGMNKGGTIPILDGALGVTMVDARHSSSFMEADGTVVYLGEPAGFVVTIAGGDSVYFAGDTALFGDMALIGQLYAPTVAALPIGDHFTMDPRAAAFASKLLGVRTVIPCHYGTFPLLHGTPDQLRAELGVLGLDVNVAALEPGQTYG